MAIITTLDDNSDVTKLLESYVQSGNISFLLGSGASMPAIEVAGDIESEIDELIQNDQHDEADLQALEFIEEIENISAQTLAGRGDDDIEQTLSQYVEFLSVVDRILFERKNLLLPRQANVFTTNYDIFLEYAASDLSSLVLNDGFDRTSSLSGDYILAAERYFDRTYRSGTVYTRQAEIPTINLIKIHGSLTWRKRADKIVFRDDYPVALSDDEKDDPDSVKGSLDERAIVLPNLRKFGSTLMDRIYYDLLRIFANVMDRENAVLISFGFSFDDEHILEITRRALRNPTSQLIVLAYDGDAAASFAEKFENQRNVLIVAPDEDEVTDFEKFNSILTDVAPDSVGSND